MRAPAIIITRFEVNYNNSFRTFYISRGAVWNPDQ
jgi:hypothetical protein